MTNHLPRHIAIIMDGNGRWAKKRFMPRIVGHKAGVETVRQIVKACARRQIQVLSLFAFSSENWRRPESEINFLMDLFSSRLDNEVAELHRNNIQLRIIGDRTKLGEKLNQKIHEAEQLTSHNTGLVLMLAIDYGGQWDICQATQKIMMAVAQGELQPSEMTPALFSKYLSFGDLPDPDLLIRTSGELRISNFMLWQLAYAELYFSPVLWPDFNEQELENALQHYTSRERRFGRSGEQLSEISC